MKMNKNHFATLTNSVAVNLNWTHRRLGKVLAASALGEKADTQKAGNGAVGRRF